MRGLGPGGRDAGTDVTVRRLGTATGHAAAVPPSRDDAALSRAVNSAQLHLRIVAVEGCGCHVHRTRNDPQFAGEQTESRTHGCIDL